MDSLYENGWQQKNPILKEKVVNWAAGGGHINALEWERMELLRTVMSSPVLRNMGTIML
jgi:hypothetical protein